MKKMCIGCAGVLLALATLLVVGIGTAQARTISGELVVSKGSARQFRIVDHGGFFNAPPGVSIEDLDGKPVEVELGADNRVLSITEKHIPTDPLLRSYQIITGQLIIGNNATGAFSITGAGSYIAPPGVDLRPYANQMVDVFIDENGQVKSIDRSRNASLPLDSYNQPVATTCSYNSREYSEGIMVCQSGTRFRCDAGAWRNMGGPCLMMGNASCLDAGSSYTSGTTRCEGGSQLLCDDGVWRDLRIACVSDVTMLAPPVRSCLVGDATVGNGSTICRAGVMYRCNDGNWNRAGSACQ